MALLLGLLAAAPPGHAQEPQAAAAEIEADNAITLNLRDAEISALVDRVAEYTGKHFVIDPRVKGRVTVISPKPMARDELYQIFLSILQVHGFAAIPVGQVIKIVPDVKARQEGSTDVDGELRGDDIVTRVISIENVQAAQLVPVLRPLVPQEGHLAASPTTNALVISDRASNVRRMARIVEQIDRSSDASVEVIRLSHASATEVARVLSGLQRQNVQGQPQAASNIIADERTNSVLISGEEPERLRMRAVIAHLDTPLEAGGAAQVVYLRYAKAADLLPVLTGLTGTLVQGQAQGQQQQAAPPGQNEVNIQADETANALVIMAPPDVFRSLQQVIRQLDIRRAQVLVEAIIAEISFDKARQLGVQWLFDTTDGPNAGFLSGTNFTAGTSIGGMVSSIVEGDLPSLGDGMSLSIGRLTNGTIDYAVLLRALANDATTNILSTPSLMTLDNAEAEIVVGQNVPFVTGQFTNTGAAAGSVNPFQTITREDIGITLRVTPQINEGNAVKLLVEQEVSSIAPSTTEASDIITNKRSIKTEVMVEDGNIVVLGGLIDDSVQITQQKVPGLGDVPVLGRLFRYDSTQKVKRNLVVFLRPVIVRDAATQTRLSAGKYSYMRAMQMEVQDRGVQLMPDEDHPVLPPMPPQNTGDEVQGNGPPTDGSGIAGRDPDYYEGDCVCSEEHPDEFARSFASTR